MKELLAKATDNHVTEEDTACAADFQLVPPTVAGTMADSCKRRDDDEPSFDYVGKKASRTSNSGYHAPAGSNPPWKL